MGPGPSPEQQLDDLKLLGLQGDALENARALLNEDAPNDADIWEENLDTVRIFLAMERQWRKLVLPKAIVFEGLRLDALQTVAWALGIAMTPDIFNGLLTMEGEALLFLNK